MREIELLFVGFLLGVTESTCPIKLDPPTLVVKYGDPARILCSATDSDYIKIGWEARIGGTDKHLISETPYLEWVVPNLTDWKIVPKCFINPPRGSPKKQCVEEAEVVLYDIPKEIHLSSDLSTQHEGRTVEFTCAFNSSVPFKNLTTLLYMNGLVVHAQPGPPAQHVAAIFQIPATKEMNGATFRCEAQIDLEPQVPLISKFSNDITLEVLHPPRLTCPQNFTIPENTLHNLTCTADGNPQPKIDWYKDGDMVGPPEKFTRRDAGLYHVSAYSTLGTIEATVNINVIYPPSHIMELEDLEVEVGSSVQLKCSSKSNPRPLYYWTYNPADNVKTFNDDGVSLLFVENATRDNAGIYTCHAENIHGGVSENATLTVKGDLLECPLEMAPEKLVVRYRDPGQRVTCRPTGSVRLEGIWWEVLPWPQNQPGTDWSADLYEDWDLKPVCHATFTGLGTCSKSLNFTLYKTPDSVSVRSDLTVNAAGQLLNLLICDIVSVAPAKNLVVQWLQGNQILLMADGVTLQVTGCEGNTSTECRLDTSSPVNISASIRLPLHHSLTAIRCTAWLDLALINPPETMTSETLNVSVYYKPVINTTKLPKTVPVFHGYPEELLCEADGHPLPEILWTYTADRVINISRGTIQVSEPGVYNCSATNLLGSTYHQVHVIPKEDYLPLIAGLVAVTVVIISIIFIFIYSIYYTNTKMRRYSLKNPKHKSHNGNVANSGWELPLPMTKLS